MPLTAERGWLRTRMRRGGHGDRSCAETAGRPGALRLGALGRGGSQFDVEQRRNVKPSLYTGVGGFIGSRTLDLLTDLVRQDVITKLVQVTEAAVSPRHAPQVVQGRQDRRDQRPERTQLHVVVEAAADAMQWLSISPGMTRRPL
jgi:hypothetical protein